MARLAYDEGMLLDVASGGELHVALAAGVPADALHVARQQQERRRAARGDRRPACATSSSTASTSSTGSTRSHAEGLPVPDVLLRITPGVHAHTHEFIATGQDDSKFGFNLGNGDAERAVERVRAIAERRPRRAALPHRLQRVRGVELRQGGRGDGRLRRAARPARARARRRPRRRLRRGRGGADDHRSGATCCSTRARRSACAADVSVEPGRAIVAAAAITVYTVGTIKHIPGVRTYVAVDGGMSDNPRPVLYGSGYEAFLPRAVGADATAAGAARRQALRERRRAAVRRPPARRHRRRRPAGHAGHRRLRPQRWASNYNKLTRPPVVFVADGEARARRAPRDATTTCSRSDVG